MKKLVFLVLLGGFVFNSLLSAQNAEGEVTFNVAQTSDEIDFSNDAESADGGFLHENDGKKHFFTAIGGMLFFNVGLASYNRFVLGSGWAQVGPDEWNHFWEREVKFDRDWYWTNFVLHPYQGGIYYQVARSSNLNQLEALGVTILGASFWEYFCETNAPSTNDLFYTTVGSFAMGEMLYRLSLNADEISELLGMVINPTRAWSELILRQKPLGSSRNIHELSFKLGVGSAQTHTNIINCSDFPYEANELFPVFFNPSIYVAYNDPYGHDSNSPYSQFELEISAAAGAGSGEGADCQYADLDEKFMYQIRILSNGMLFSRSPVLSEESDTTIGLVMEYDFDWHQFYELSALGSGLAIKQRLRFQKSNLEWQLHGAWNVLGTTDYYYYHRKIINQTASVVRNYSMTTGPMAVFTMRLASQRGLAACLGIRAYGMYDFYNQLQSDSSCPSTGWEWIGVADLNFEFPVSKVVRLGLGDEVYLKRTFYKKVPDIFQVLNSGSVYAKFQMK